MGSCVTMILWIVIDIFRYFSIFALYVSKNCVFFFAINIEIFDTYRYFTIFGIDNYRHEKASIDMAFDNSFRLLSIIIKTTSKRVEHIDILSIVKISIPIFFDTLRFLVSIFSHVCDVYIIQGASAVPRLILNSGGQCPPLSLINAVNG